jgi:hypothetical protein
VCDCALIFPEGVAVRPEELNDFFRPLLSIEDSEPADLDDGFNAIRIVCVGGEKPILDTLNDYAAYVRLIVVV